MVGTRSSSLFVSSLVDRLACARAHLGYAMVALAALAAAPAAVHAQYTALFIPAPTSGQPAGSIAPLALNNLGQVLVSNSWGPPPNRGPALYANGATVALSFPAGYHWADIVNAAGLNDTGVAMLAGQRDTAAGTNGGVRPIVWQGGVGHALPLPMTPADCGGSFQSPPPPPWSDDTFNAFPMGLNRAGHVLVYACNRLWLMDAAGNILKSGPPPVVDPMAGLVPAFFEELFGSHLNDADVASAETGVPSIDVATHPGVLTGLSTFAPMPVDHGYALAINNRDQLLAFVQSGNAAECLLGTGSAVADLGSCAFASLNHLGQVAFMTSSFAGLPRLYKDGNVLALTLPAEAPGLVFVGSPRGLNDAGQIIGFDMFSRGVLLTPTGACAVDATAQVTVRHVGLRLDPSTGHYTTTVRVRNNGATTLPAPVSVVVDGLPATATLVNTSGATSCDAPAGSAYLDLPVSIAPGRAATGTLEFIDPSGGRLRYATRVLAGPGRR